MKGRAARRHGVAWVLACAAGFAPAASKLDALWDFSRPALSEQRFRAAIAEAQGEDALILHTQLARALGLQGRFDEARGELDALEPLLDGASAELRVRWLLERGRMLRSSGHAADAKPLFIQAFERAEAAAPSKLEDLAADALHMVALAADTLDERIAWNRRTVDYAQRAADARARGWRAAALNNIGSDLRGAGRLDDAMQAFREALAAYEAIGRPARVRFARWQIANVLRLQGRADEALVMQQALERDLEAAGQTDVYVWQELAALHAARGEEAQAARYLGLVASERAKR